MTIKTALASADNTDKEPNSGDAMSTTKAKRILPAPNPPVTIQTFEEFLNEAWADAWEKSDESASEIFGDSESLPDDELELVFSPAFLKLSRPARIQALAEHRARKGVEVWN